jgi:hypothetical protein
LSVHADAGGNLIRVSDAVIQGAIEATAAAGAGAIRDILRQHLFGRSEEGLTD